MSKMSNFKYFLEIVWLCVGVIGLTLATYEFITHGFKKSIPLYIIAVIAFAVYSLRRYTRKNRK